MTDRKTIDTTTFMRAAEAGGCIDGAIARLNAGDIKGAREYLEVARKAVLAEHEDAEKRIDPKGKGGDHIFEACVQGAPNEAAKQVSGVYDTSHITQADLDAAPQGTTYAPPQ